MCNLATTAERLRVVREAQQRFLAMWAVECLLEQRQVMRKVAQDVQRVACERFADPHPHRGRSCRRDQLDGMGREL